MDTAISVGGMTKGSTKNLGKLITQVFKAGRKYNMAEDVIVNALNLIMQTIPPKNVSITNCSFQSK
jgi:predicted GNAT family N-acyltransferase